MKKSVSKTKFLGDGDVSTKSRSYVIPSNAKISQQKKGGSVKSKKVIKSKK